MGAASGRRDKMAMPAFVSQGRAVRCRGCKQRPALAAGAEENAPGSWVRLMPLCWEGMSCPEHSEGGLAFPCFHSFGFPWGTAAWLLTF